MRDNLGHLQVTEWERHQHKGIEILREVVLVLTKPFSYNGLRFLPQFCLFLVESDFLLFVIGRNFLLGHRIDGCFVAVWFLIREKHKAHQVQ